MTIDWNVIANISEPVILLFIGGWVNRIFENRPIIISYFSHVSAFLHTPQGGQPMQIHTHSVVLRNIGRQRATNVRLHHAVLPEFNIWPPIVHSIETLQDGSKDIVIPVLVPGEEVTVSYLYFPPLVVGQINAGIKSDEGFAKQITVLLRSQVPRWLSNILLALVCVGSIATCYLVYIGIAAVMR